MTTKRGRFHRMVHFLVRLFKFIGWVCVALYLISVALKSNELRQMKKEKARHEIELLKLQISGFEK